MAQGVKNLPAMQETQVQSLGWEDPLQKGMAIHCSIPAWRIPRTEVWWVTVHEVTKSQTRLSEEHRFLSLVGNKYTVLDSILQLLLQPLFLSFAKPLWNRACFTDRETEAGESWRDVPNGTGKVGGLTGHWGQPILLPDQAVCPSGAPLK